MGTNYPAEGTFIAEHFLVFISTRRCPQRRSHTVLYGSIELPSKYSASHWPGVAERLQLSKDKNTFCSRGVSHIRPEINSNIQSPGVTRACAVRVYVAPVAALVISAKSSSLPPSLLLIVRLTIAVNDSAIPRWGMGGQGGEKPFAQSAAAFYS